jgi:hypothetical protein
MTTPGPIASGLFTDNYAGIVDVAASSEPTSGQVLTATSNTAAAWADVAASLPSFFAYDSIGNVFMTGAYKNMNFNTNVVTNAAYTNNSGAITFNEDGLYQITYTLNGKQNAQSGNNFSTVLAKLQLNTGGGFADIVYSGTNSATRRNVIANLLNTSNTKCILLQVTSGDIIRLQFAISGNVTHDTQENGSTIAIVKIG